MDPRWLQRPVSSDSGFRFCRGCRSVKNAVSILRMTQNLTWMGSLPQSPSASWPGPSQSLPVFWSIPNPAAEPRGSSRRRPQPHPDTPRSKSSVPAPNPKAPGDQRKFSVIPTSSSSIPGSQPGILGGLAVLMISAGRGFGNCLAFAHSVLLELSLDGVQVHPGPGQSYGCAV